MPTLCDKCREDNRKEGKGVGVTRLIRKFTCCRCNTKVILPPIEKEYKEEILDDENKVGIYE